MRLIKALPALPIVLLAVALHLHRAPAVAPEAAAPIAVVDAVQIAVADLDRSVEFYSKVLFFEKVPEARTTRTRAARLRLGSESIELIERPEAKSPETRHAGEADGLAIAVSDIDQARLWIRRHAGRHATREASAPDRSAAGVREFSTADPDGNPLRIVQFARDTGQPRWQSPGDGIFLGIDHVTIAVADSAASLAFYRDTLGLALVGRREGRSVAGAEVRATTLRGGAGPDVELVEHSTPPATAGDAGVRRYAILVATSAAAPAPSAPARWGAGWLRAAASPGPAVASREGSILRDPDGRVIEIRANTASSIGRIVRLDPRLDRLVPRDAALEKIADGFAWVEGPVWNRAGGHLLFSDIPNNAVLKWQPGAGVSLFLKPAGYTGREPFQGREPGSNGLALDPSGRLVLCEHGDRRIARLEKDGRKTTLADRYRGKRLNSPNDLVFRSSGDLYFTDPPFGLPQAFADPGKELDFSGVSRLSPGGELSLLTRELTAPNGIAFSPSEKILYVSNADPKRPVWMAYEVRSDGALGQGRVFFDATPWVAAGKGPGLPDGLKVDREGNLFATGAGGIHVFAPDGTHLGSIETGVPTGNVAWGEDGSVLYITADTAIYRIRLSTKGVGF